MPITKFKQEGDQLFQDSRDIIPDYSSTDKSSLSRHSGGKSYECCKCPDLKREEDLLTELPKVEFKQEENEDFLNAEGVFLNCSSGDESSLHLSCHSVGKAYKCLECSNMKEEEKTVSMGPPKTEFKKEDGDLFLKSEDIPCFLEKTLVVKAESLIEHNESSYFRTKSRGQKNCSFSRSSSYDDSEYNRTSDEKTELANVTQLNEVSKRSDKSQKSRLLTHQRSHSGGKPSKPLKYKCSECPYKSYHKNNLLTHQRTHSDERPFKCSECAYSTKHKSTLVSHQRTHSGEKPYKCSQCSYSSCDKSSLTRHLRVHSGEKPYKCSECSYRATTRTNLQAHERTHSGEKPYKCSECSYSAKQNTSVVRHQRIHSGKRPFKCSECPYRAINKSNLVTHQRTHSGEKPYKCPTCSYRASTNSNVVRHQLNHSCKKLAKSSKFSDSGNSESKLHDLVEIHDEELPNKSSGSQDAAYTHEETSTSSHKVGDNHCGNIKSQCEDHEEIQVKKLPYKSSGSQEVTCIHEETSALSHKGGEDPIFVKPLPFVKPFTFVKPFF